MRFVTKENMIISNFAEVLITSFSCEIAGGLRTLFTDKSKLAMGVAGTTALAAGIFTTRFVWISYHFPCFSLSQTMI